MRRVLVIGSGGSGKSTVAARLGELLELEVNHLDKFYWRAGWVEPARDEWIKTVTELMDKDSWVMDGNYSGTLELRLRKCDTIVFLDLPRVLCLWRIVKRFLIYRNGNRPDVAEGCPENSISNLLAGCGIILVVQDQRSSSCCANMPERNRFSGYVLVMK